MMYGGWGESKEKMGVEKQKEEMGRRQMDGVSRNEELNRRGQGGGGGRVEGR